MARKASNRVSAIVVGLRRHVAGVGADLDGLLSMHQAFWSRSRRQREALRVAGPGTADEGEDIALRDDLYA